MRLPLVLMLALLAGCQQPMAPSGPPFSLPSAVLGDWTGHDPSGLPASVHGDGHVLAGSVDGWPLLLRDDHTFIRGTYVATWEQLWANADGTFGFTAAGGRWTFAHAKGAS